MKTIIRIIMALLIAVAVFWFVRLSGWLGSLTTQRTAFYFVLNHGMAWIIAGIVFIWASIELP